MLTRLVIKVALIAILCCLGSLYSPIEAQVWRIDRLYARPDGTSQVVVPLPKFFVINVEQVNDYSDCVWILLDVDLSGVFKGHWTGWVYIPKSPNKVSN
jgi:hypothetical protein